MKLPSELLEKAVLSQYANSPNLMALLEIYAEEFDLLQQLNRDIVDLRYIDNAFGVQLDYIGLLVGAKRTLSGVKVTGNFGYLANAEALGMGKIEDVSVGGILRSIEDQEYQDIRLPDDKYLNWIKAKILLNNSDGGKEDCIAFFKLLLNDPTLPVQISIPSRATTEIRLGRKLSLTDAAICIAFAKAVKPVGVTMRLYDTVGEILLNDIDLIGEYFG